MDLSDKIFTTTQICIGWGAGLGWAGAVLSLFLALKGVVEDRTTPDYGQTRARTVPLIAHAVLVCVLVRASSESRISFPVPVHLGRFCGSFVWGLWEAKIKGCGFMGKVVGGKKSCSGYMPFEGCGWGGLGRVRMAGVWGCLFSLSQDQQGAVPSEQPICTRYSSVVGGGVEAARCRLHQIF